MQLVRSSLSPHPVRIDRSVLLFQGVRNGWRLLASLASAKICDYEAALLTKCISRTATPYGSLLATTCYVTVIAFDSLVCRAEST